MKPKFTFKIINSNLHEYDANGNLIHRKDSSGEEERYDSIGRLIYYKDSDGYEKWYEYDANGNEIRFKDFSGYESWNEYDDNGNLIHHKTSDGDECWYDAIGYEITKEQFDAIHAPKPSCVGKVVEIDGKKYKLVEA